MKVLQSPLAKAILRDPVAAGAMMDALMSRGIFNFDGKTYRPLLHPMVRESDTPTMLEIARRVMAEWRDNLVSLRDKQ